MKFVQPIAMVVLCACVFTNAYAGDPVWMPRTQAPQKRVSVMFKPVHTPKQAIDLCREYRRKQIAGFVLMPVGAAAFAVGIVMTYKGVRSIMANYNASNYERIGQATTNRDITFVTVGAGLIVTGLALMPGGFIMSGISRTKFCRYCRAGGALYIAPSPKGNGVVLKF